MVRVQKCSKNGPFHLRRQRFPKNGVYKTVRSVQFHGPFRCTVRSVSTVFGFLATDAVSINFAKNLAIPRPVALIPSCCNFRDISPGSRPWRWWYITTCFDSDTGEHDTCSAEEYVNGDNDLAVCVDLDDQ